MVHVGFVELPGNDLSFLYTIKVTYSIILYSYIYNIYIYILYVLTYYNIYCTNKSTIYVDTLYSRLSQSSHIYYVYHVFLCVDLHLHIYTLGLWNGWQDALLCPAQEDRLPRAGVCRAAGGPCRLAGFMTVWLGE